MIHIWYVLHIHIWYLHIYIWYTHGLLEDYNRPRCLRNWRNILKKSIHKYIFVNKSITQIYTCNILHVRNILHAIYRMYAIYCMYAARKFMSKTDTFILAIAVLSQLTYFCLYFDNDNASYLCQIYAWNCVHFSQHSYNNWWNAMFSGNNFSPGKHRIFF